MERQLSLTEMNFKSLRTYVSSNYESFYDNKATYEVKKDGENS